MLRYYDLYQRLQLQFDVRLMMGAMDARNMQSDFALNKDLHTVASCWILLICMVYVMHAFSTGAKHAPMGAASQISILASFFVNMIASTSIQLNYCTAYLVWVVEIIILGSVR